MITEKYLTDELCPHCEFEVQIPDDAPSPCPSCKEVIVPCSQCDMHNDCGWTPTGCNKFPANRPIMVLEEQAYRAKLKDVTFAERYSSN